MSGTKQPSCCAQARPKRVPNKETVEALRQSRDRVGLKEYASVEEMKADLEREELS